MVAPARVRQAVGDWLGPLRVGAGVSAWFKKRIHECVFWALLADVVGSIAADV